jgi:predicted kinase
LFDNVSEESNKIRMKCKEEALNDLIKYLTEEDGQVAIYNGMNTRRDHRAKVHEVL